MMAYLNILSVSTPVYCMVARTWIYVDLGKDHKKPRYSLHN